MTEVFTQEAEFIAALKAHVEPFAQPELLEPLIQGISAGDALWRTTPAVGGTALNLKLGRFFIRDDDLPFLETLGTAATALAATGGGAGLALTSIIPVVTGLATMGWSLWRKGVVLSGEDIRILGILRQHGSKTAADLLPLMKEADVDFADVAALTHRLHRLTEVDTRDGTEVKMAKEEDGLWRALSV